VRPTETQIALARLDTSFIAEGSMPTAGTSAEFTELLCQRVSDLVKSHSEIYFEGIGVSLPGRVDSRTQKLVFAPNLKWRDLDLKTPLERTTGLPVELEKCGECVRAGGNLVGPLRRKRAEPDCRDGGRKASAWG